MIRNVYFSAEPFGKITPADNDKRINLLPAHDDASEFLLKTSHQMMWDSSKSRQSKAK